MGRLSQTPRFARGLQAKTPPQARVGHRWATPLSGLLVAPIRGVGLLAERFSVRRLAGQLRWACRSQAALGHLSPPGPLTGSSGRRGVPVHIL